MVDDLEVVQGSGGVRWITLDRPARLNSFTGDDYQELADALRSAADSDQCRVAVLTGSGRAFSAGADRSLLDPNVARSSQDRAGLQFTGLLDALAEFPKPLVAAVNGVAVGVGCTMLLWADVVVAAASARFRMPFTELGVVPEAGSSALVHSRMRAPDAMWAMLSSEWIEAHDAARSGLVWKVVADDDLDASVDDVARRLAVLDPASVAATKALLVAGRADSARAAVSREMGWMRRLLEDRRSS
jgi:enoyl-CoA hydratase/carnithine racemase